MFDFSWGHFIVVAIVALIVIGPKELPAVLRTIGQWTTKIRRMASEFQGQFQEAMREAEMADLKKEIGEIGDAARGFTSQFNDPVNFQDTTKWEPPSDSVQADTPEAGKPVDTMTPPEPPPHDSAQPHDLASPANAAVAPAPETAPPVAAAEAAPAASPLALESSAAAKAAGEGGVNP